MDAMVSSPARSSSKEQDSARTDDAVPPVVVEAPDAQTIPLVLASPHSGTRYTDAFRRASRLDAQTLRRSEDSYVHELFAAGPALGAPLVRATFPRAFLDVNREPYELDPGMFDGPLPRHANTRSPRVAAGLGTIARIVANGAEIYPGRIPASEIDRRLDGYYRPYHSALQKCIRLTQRRFGHCILLDCHSMPSGTIPGSMETGDTPVADFVLGDCHGMACTRRVVDAVQEVLEEAGYRVTRNAPYAGGFTTRHYGRPLDRIHALQIEINRALYMDERTYKRRPRFQEIAAQMTRVVKALAALPADIL